MAWTDPNLNTTIKIRTIHITELQRAIEALENSCSTHNTTNKIGNNITDYSAQYGSVRSSKNSAVYNSAYNNVYTADNRSVCGHVVGVHNQSN